MDSPYVVASPGSDVARDVQVFQGLGLTRLADLRIKNMAPSFLKDHSSNSNIPKENWQSLLPEEPSLTHLEMMLWLESHSEKHLLHGSQWKAKWNKQHESLRLPPQFQFWCHSGGRLYPCNKPITPFQSLESHIYRYPNICNLTI